MNKRSFFNVLAVGVIILVIGIGGWWFRRSPSLIQGNGVLSTPTAALISKSAPVTVSLLVNPDRLENLPGSSLKELSQLKTSLFADTRIDYRQDIQPWLGQEISLAVTSVDLDRTPENGQQPGYLMALATNNAKKSREFVDLFFSGRALAGAKIAVEQSQGVKVIYETEEAFPVTPAKKDVSTEKNQIAGAVVGDRFVLFANHPKVIFEAINNLQVPDLNLTSSIKYQEALKQLPSGSIASAFLNLPAVAAWQGLKLATRLPYESQVVSLALKSQGLFAQTTILAAPQSELTPPVALSGPVGAMQYIPSATGLAISGSDLSHLDKTDLAKLGTQVATALSGTSDLISSLVNQPLADLQQRWGINLRADIFSWVQGEYALGLSPEKEQTNPDWIFVAEKSTAATDGIARLDALATSLGLSINPITVGNQQIFAWTKLIAATNKDPGAITLAAQVQGVHTTVGNYEIFANSIAMINAALTAEKNSLANNRNFKDSIGALPKQNQGYVYLDWQKSHEILERQFPILQLAEVIGKPFFERLRSLTVSSYGNESELLKAGVLFDLKAK